jgi:hypothetical protein
MHKEVDDLSIQRGKKKGIKEICQMIHVFKTIFPEKWMEKVKAFSWPLKIFK